MSTSRVISLVSSSCRSNDHAGSTRDSQLSRLLISEWIGVACLNIYLQANYTGPAIPQSSITDVLDVLPSSIDLASLEVDGEFPYTKAAFPIFLVLARSILHALSLPEYKTWGDAVVVDEQGKGKLPLLPPSQQPPGSYRRLLTHSLTASLWASRAVVMHRRLLSGRQPSPTLWAECDILYSLVLPSLAPEDEDERNEYCKETAGDGKVEEASMIPDYVAGRILLEWGLALHHFDEGDKGKKAFARAQRATGLKAQLTAAMGRRTKYQQMDLPQMLVVAKSAVPYENPSAATTMSAGEKGVFVEKHEKKAEPTMVSVENPAPIHRTAHHSEDSILLEKTKFTGEQEAEENLHPIDQSVLLALCLDVSNSNAKDGLTTEQMVPYVQRALVHANNWMVYSTALMERAWIDFESPYARDRALLQLQALVDQHSSRLTITQSTTQSVEESAPSQERLLYLHNIVYPSQWELKRDLAERYAKMGVVGSAAEIFLELGLYDEVRKG